MEKIEERVSELISILRTLYPDAKCALHHKNAFELLVATILSAQCTDERVNSITPALFKKYPTVQDFAKASQTELEKDIKSTGFFRNKAKNIIASAKAIVEKHKGKVPQSLEDLTELPGVGRKTANVILGTAFGIASGIVVDTHVKRLANRLGLSSNSDPDKIEEDLKKIVPREDWIEFSHLLILHGRNCCNARHPNCTACKINSLCPKIGVK